MGAAVKQIAIGAALITASILIPGSGFALAGLLHTALVGAGISVSLGGIATAIRKPDSSSIKDNLQGRLLTIRQAAAPRRVLYGLVRVGGVLSFANHTGLRIAPTDQNQLVITIAGHAISDWKTFLGDTNIGVRFDDDVPELDSGGIGVGVWTGKVFIQTKNGYDGDEAFPSLLSDSVGLWTADHRQRGCAAAYVRINYDERLFPNSVPNITFLVRGKPVFDPRTDSPITVVGATNATPIVIEATGHGFVGGEVVRIVGVNQDNMQQPNGTWGVDFIDADHFSLQGSDGTQAYVSGGQIFKLGYSNNAALVTADYMMDPWIGMGVPYAKIREAVLLAAANVCDEEIEIDEGSPPSTEFRYAINGTFETSEQHGEILAQMANAMAGHVTYIGGEWHIIPGAFRLPVMELTDADVVAPMQVQFKRSKRDLVNGIKGTFPSALHNYIETDFPALHGTAYLAEDQGIRVWKDIFLPFTTSATACQRIAEIDLNRNRRQISVQMTCSMRAYELQPGDVVEFTHSRWSWEVETFEVAECGLGQNEDGAMVVSLQLVQTDVNVYGFAVDDYGDLIDLDLLNLLQRKLPFGLTPGLAPGIQSTIFTEFPYSDYRFIIGQAYKLIADGSVTARLRMGFFIPVNVFSINLRRPRTRTLAASYSGTGGLIKGGQRYYLAVVAIENAGSPPEEYRQTALSDISSVDVPQTSPNTDENTVTIHDLRWHPDTTTWRIYFGTDPFRLSRQAGAQLEWTGPDAQPTSITFKGVNAPVQVPDGYFHHLGGAPDQRFDRIRIKMFRGIHHGIFGGKVVSIQPVDSPPTQYSITLNNGSPFTANALAGRYISLFGLKGTGLELSESGGMPRADFLIDSNTADTVLLASGQVTTPQVAGFEEGAVVVIRTKATELGEDATGVYIADTGFGQGGQELGDPDAGGGENSLRGAMLRIIAGTGAGKKYVIAGNTIPGDDKIYIEGEWDVTPDTTSIFIVTDGFPVLQHDSDQLAAQYFDSPTHIFLDIPKNLIGGQYLVQGIALSVTGREAPEESSPFREIYIFGEADAGRLVDEDTILTVYDRYVRADSTAGDITITVIDPEEMPGVEVIIENVGTGGNTVTVQAPSPILIGGELTRELADGQAILIRGYHDPL